MIVNIVFTIISISLFSTLVTLMMSYATGRNLFMPTLEDKIKSQDKQKQFNKDLEYRYKQIINSIIRFKTKHKLFLASKYKKEEIEIVLDRTFSKLTPYELDFMTYEQFDAQNTLISICLIAVFILPILFTPSFIKTILSAVLILSLFGINFLRLIVLEGQINTQNSILEKNFGDFYLTQHYILLTEHKNPLSKGLKLYEHKTEDPFMKQWIKVTLQLIRNSTEEQVIERYLILYKDIYTLCNLLNIEKQIIQGADCRLQLQGLRDEVIQKRKIDITENAEKVTNTFLIIRYVVFVVIAQVGIGLIVYIMLSGNVQMVQPGG